MAMIHDAFDQMPQVLRGYLRDNSLKVEISHYQSIAKRTDRNPATGKDGISLPLFGLFGETGSLLSEAKKQLREREAHFDSHAYVLEELGDCLWYLANLATRLGYDLLPLARDIAENEHTRYFKDLDSDTIQCIDSKELDAALFALGTDVSHLLKHESSLLGNRRTTDTRLLLRAVLSSLVQTSRKYGLTMDAIARFNLRKTNDRWPIDKQYLPLFDDIPSLPAEEKLPRTLSVNIEERTSGGRSYVIQKIGSVIIGDRLTDNISDPDDYRFHDVFHWAYVAVLGWSPVTRRLLHCKRKSIPEVDENEDGARAAIIEEAISAWVFQQARRGRNYFKNLNELEYSILKSIRSLTTGFEAEVIPLWQWEDAILQGYAAFNYLREKRKGMIQIDTNSRSIKVVE